MHWELLRAQLEDSLTMPRDEVRRELQALDDAALAALTALETPGQVG